MQVFEGAIPFYLARELCSQQDVEELLKDLKGKQLYCFPATRSGQGPQGSDRP